MTLPLFLIRPPPANRPDDSGLETRESEVWYPAHGVHGRTDHQGSVASEGRSEQNPTMLMLREGIEFRDGSLKSSFDFLQTFVIGSVSSSKELKVLLAEDVSCAAGSPRETRLLDLPEIVCCRELCQGKPPFSLLAGI